MHYFAIATAAIIGSEPIYLQCCCRSHTSVNKSICYNEIQLITVPLPQLLPFSVNEP